MQHIKWVCTLFFASLLFQSFGQQHIIVQSFNKVIVSPFIRVNFVAGDRESITIESSRVSSDLIRVDVNGSTLRLYLEGAKELPEVDLSLSRNKRDEYPDYSGTEVVATITYKNLQEVSIRGEEPAEFHSPLVGSTFRLKVYGTAAVIIREANLETCHASIYGESSLEIQSGRVEYQQYTVYGKGSVNSLGTTGSRSKITSYGEGDFQVNISEQIRFNSFGDAVLQNKGNAPITKGIQLGETRINRL